MQQFKYTSNTCDNQCFHKYAIVYPKYANPCFQIFGRPPGQVIGGPGVKLGQCLATGTCGILDPLLKLVGLKSFEDILKTRSVWETCCKYTNPYWKNTTNEVYVEQVCQWMFSKICNCILKICQSMSSKIWEASRPSYLGARKWVRTVRSTRYLWHLASMAESIRIDIFWKPFENRIGLGNMLNIWQFMLTNATLEVYIKQMRQSMFSKICIRRLKIYHSMLPSIWEASRPSYWGARKWVRTVPSTRYLWHLASMAKSIWIDMFLSNFENRVGLRNMLQICKSMVSNTILEAHAEQICQSMFSKLCHRILNIWQSMCSSIWEASRPSYWGSRRWVTTLLFSTPGQYLAPGTCGILGSWQNPDSLDLWPLWNHGFAYFQNILSKGICFQNIQQSPETNLSVGALWWSCMRGLDVHVALSTPAGQRFTL